MTQLILSIGYDRPKLDFSALLHGHPEVRVSRSGPQRRVQVEAPEGALEELRGALPEGVRIEPVIGYGHGAAGA